MELCMNMLPSENVQVFKSMQSKITDTYVDISKVSMTEAAEVLRLNSIYTRTLRLES